MQRKKRPGTGTRVLSIAIGTRVRTRVLESHIAILQYQYGHIGEMIRRYNATSCIRPNQSMAVMYIHACMHVYRYSSHRKSWIGTGTRVRIELYHGIFNTGMAYRYCIARVVGR